MNKTPFGHGIQAYIAKYQPEPVSALALPPPSTQHLKLHANHDETPSDFSSNSPRNKAGVPGISGTNPMATPIMLDDRVRAGVPSSQSTSDLVWDLTHVLPSTKGPEFDQTLETLEKKVKEIESLRATLDDIATPAELVRVIDLDTEIYEICSRLGYWGHLSFSADTRDESVKAFMAQMEELTTDVSNRTRFVDLWWKGLPDDRAAALMPDDPELRHYLTRVRVFKPHTLEESEERIIAFKDVTGANAIDRIRDILTSEFKFKDPKSGTMVTQSELSRHVHDPDPALREAAYKELWTVYANQESMLSYLYHTVVTDWANENLKLRKYSSPISVRNKGNDVPDEAVETLLKVCRRNAPLFHRYFDWKGKRLGLAPMSRYHIYAPLDEAKVEVPYEAARDKVLKVFNRFSPRVAEEARRVFDERHVHVMPADGKQGGAFCATVTSTMTPYVFLNHTGDASSLKTLAHEMGHAVHSLLAKDRHPLVAHSTLPMAETASVFAEMLLHDEMMSEATVDQRVSLVSDKLGEIYATVMRQAYFVIFEKEAHDRIPKGATATDLHKVYRGLLEEQFGPNVEIPKEFQGEWTYIPHIFASPFYCYAYSFGMLLSLALYGMYKESGPEFVPKYEALLGAGGSRSAEDLLAELGVDIRDDAFWQKGFDVIDEMMVTLEKSG